MLLARHLVKARYASTLFLSQKRVMNYSLTKPSSCLSLFSCSRRYKWTSFKAFFQGEKPSARQQFSKYGRESQDPYRAEYEKHVKERTEKKLNWGIQNRWEQRELDDIYKNKDIRAIQFTDFNKQLMEASIIDVKEFKSIDEIYYYIDNLIKEGISEQMLIKAIDVFIRDAEQFLDKDLENPTFKLLIREVSKNLVTFSKERSYCRVAQFMDMYCIDDSLLWVNLELFTMKKEHMLSSKSLVKIMSHFARQQEGSKDFYRFIEYQFYSKKFDDVTLDDLVSLGHNFYSVHTGSRSFFQDFSEKLVDKMDDTISTFNILRVLQTFAEIGPKFPDVFQACEYHILKRYEQLILEEMTCAAAAFAIAGQGSTLLFNLFEKEIYKNPNLDLKTLKDVCRAFIFSLRGSKLLFKAIEPQICAYLDKFTLNEQCFLLSVYHEKKLLSKVFQDTLEKSIASRLRMTKEISIEEIAMVVNVYTTTRACSREFQKLMEFTVLQRLDDLRSNIELYHFVGGKFERSGFCSIDTMKVLKEQLKNLEAEETLMS